MPRNKPYYDAATYYGDENVQNERELSVHIGVRHLIFFLLCDILLGREKVGVRCAAKTLRESFGLELRVEHSLVCASLFFSS